MIIYPGGEYEALINYVRKFDSVQFIMIISGWASIARH
jgi:hypothetical protein